MNSRNKEKEVAAKISLGRKYNRLANGTFLATRDLIYGNPHIAFPNVKSWEWDPKSFAD